MLYPGLCETKMKVLLPFDFCLRYPTDLKLHSLILFQLLSIPKCAPSSTRILFYITVEKELNQSNYEMKPDNNDTCELEVTLCCPTDGQVPQQHGSEQQTTHGVIDAVCGRHNNPNRTDAACNPATLKKPSTSPF